MTRRGTARAIVLVAMVSGLLAATTTAAEADHSIVERVSLGPTGGNADAEVTFHDLTPDGRYVLFSTGESLLPEDDDGGAHDLYVRGGGQTRLATPGLPGLIWATTPATLSDDGQRAVFETYDSLVPEDTDTRRDVYVSEGDQEVLVSPGTGDDVLDDASLAGISSDATSVVIWAFEQLTDDDTDDVGDLYLWHDGTLTLMTLGPAGGNGPHVATFQALSGDASVLVFATDERLVDADQDDSEDLYRRAGGQTTLLSRGATGGNGAVEVVWVSTAPDGSRTLFRTDESLVAADVDSTTDLYLAHDGTVDLVTPGTAEEPATWTGDNPALDTVAFLTAEPLVPEDGDAFRDLYAVHNGQLELVSTGPTAPDEIDNLGGRWVSGDGSRIVFTSFSALTAADTDQANDLYEHSGGQTRLLTPGAINQAANFRGASRDGSRVFFDTREALLPSDTDLVRDVYEVSGSGLSKVTPGNDDFSANLSRVSADGSSVYWTTQEQVTADDTDEFTDVYLARIAAPKNLTPPKITGNPGTGQTLTCSPGTWSDAESFAYRWNRDGTQIPGATAPTYVVQGTDVGHALTCTVIATGDGGSTSATSAPVTVASPSPTGPLPGPCANAAVGTAGADLLRGTAFGDVLFGLAGPDRLRGLAAKDCLIGGPGRDRLAGGPGFDKLGGGKASDRLNGGSGRDRLRGAAGGDLLNGGDGHDELVAGLGDDTVRARDGKSDRVRCGSGHDVAVVDQQDQVSGCEVVWLE